MLLLPSHTDAQFIGGTWVPSSGASGGEVVNPATEELIGVAPVANADEVDSAIAAARQAFDEGPWRRMAPTDRAAMLQRMHDVFVRRAEEIKALIIAEAGSTHKMTNGMQFATALEHARYCIAEATRPDTTPLPVELAPGPNGRTVLGTGVAVREPVGVVVAITPFNVPFNLNVTKSFAALAMGNTVVLKPSPLTPFEAWVVAEAAEEAGLPPGVFNVINGGVEAGRALTTDPRVDLITFTGSDQVGATIAAQAAPTLTRCVLELGGKSALIVCDDADLNAAAGSALNSLTVHAGQGCAATSRLLVHESVRSRFVELLADRFASVQVGDPADPASTMGPLIRPASRDRVEELVAAGVDDGGSVVTGGRRPAGLSTGWYFEPTLIDGVDNRSRVAREEIFGPVGVVLGFSTDEEAVALANDSDFGLAGGVYSADVGRAYEIAREVRTGKVSLNGGSGKMSSQQPFGGIKRSGYGRELGHEGLDEFTYTKVIAFHGG